MKAWKATAEENRMHLLVAREFFHESLLRLGSMHFLPGNFCRFLEEPPSFSLLAGARDLWRKIDGAGKENQGYICSRWNRLGRMIYHC